MRLKLDVERLFLMKIYHDLSGVHNQTFYVLHFTFRILIGEAESEIKRELNQRDFLWLSCLGFVICFPS